MPSRRFPPLWRIEQIPGGFKVPDANGQALAYVYARETREQADIAKVLTMDEAWRIASNIARPITRQSIKASRAARELGWLAISSVCGMICFYSRKGR